MTSPYFLHPTYTPTLESPSPRSPSITFHLTPATPPVEARIQKPRPPLRRTSASLGAISLQLAKRVPSPEERSPYPPRMRKAPTEVSMSASSEGMLADGEGDEGDDVFARRGREGLGGMNAVANSWREWCAKTQLSKPFLSTSKVHTTGRRKAVRRFLSKKRRESLTAATATAAYEEVAMRLTSSALRSLEHWTAPPPLLLARMNRQLSIESVSTFRGQEEGEDGLSSPGLSSVGSSSGGSTLVEELDALLMDQLKMYTTYKRGSSIPERKEVEVKFPRAAERQSLAEGVAHLDAQAGLVSHEPKTTGWKLVRLVSYALLQGELVLASKYCELGQQSIA